MTYTANTDYAQSPYTAIVRITYQDADGNSYQASGVMIAANIVLTAGHVVNDAVVSSIVVTPDQYGTVTPFGSVTALATTWATGAPQTGFLDEAQSQNDVGLIALSSSIGDSTGWMGLDVLYSGGTVSTAGYPNAAGGVQETESLATTDAASSAVLEYDGGSVSPGSSGSPLWVMVNGSAQVAGVVSTTTWAAQITPNDVALISAFEAKYPTVEDTTGSTTNSGAKTVSATPKITAFNGTTLNQAEVITNGGSPALSGTALSDAALTVSVDGTAVQNVTAGADGSWSFTFSKLSQGPHQISVADASGDTASISMFEISGAINGVTTSNMSSVGLAALMSQGYNFSAASGTETVMFLDGSLNIGSDTQVAQIARLYEGLLGRGPDASGLSAAASAVTGQSTAAIAASIVNSDEFQSANGSDSNEQFVQLLYKNMLGRAADSAGLLSWTDDLADGVSRAQLADGLAATTEATRHWANLTTNLWVTNGTNALIYREYQAGLNRQSTVVEVTGWSQAMQAGGTPMEVANAIANSAEFTNLHSAQSNADFISALYTNGLGRAPDAAGQQYWLTQLDSGTASRADLLLAIAQSSEAVARLDHSF